MLTAFLPYVTIPPYRATRATRARTLTASATAAPAPAAVNWKCLPSCGACCKIGGYDPEVLDDMLPKQSDRALYESMVGTDEWCRNFDKTRRQCIVYDDRPWFCRVGIQSFETLYKVKPRDMDTFAAECCTYHINEVYGEQSPEMQRFDAQVGAIWDQDPQFDDVDDNEDEQFVQLPLHQDERSADVGDETDIECVEEVCQVPGFVDVNRSE